MFVLLSLRLLQLLVPDKVSFLLVFLFGSCDYPADLVGCPTVNPLSAF